jgi:hypothetical protein
VKLLRALAARLNSWVRFPEFEHLDDMYDVWGDEDIYDHEERGL